MGIIFRNMSEDMESKDILIRQNKPENLRYQTVADECYKHGKILSYFTLICSVIMPLLLVVLQKFVVNDRAVAVFCVIAIIFWVVGMVLRNEANKYKNYGACFQQLFDESVLGIKNSSHKYIASKMITQEDRLYLMKKYKDKNCNIKKDWYNDYSYLPYNKAVFSCQKENIRWDLDLRKRYRNLLFVLAIIAIAVVITIAILTNKRVSTIVLAVFSVFTLVEYYVNSYRKIKNDVEKQSKLKWKVEFIEKNIKTDSDLWDKIEELQVEIFEYRKKAYLIPDWFYKIFRKKDQGRSDICAQALKEESKEENDEHNDKKAD